jgi:hypothetical protein
MYSKTRHPFKYALLVLVLILSTLALGQLAPAMAQPLAANPTVTVLSPSGAGSDVVGEGDDYFTQVLGAPRDMNDHTDMLWQEFGVNNITVAGGDWTGTASNSGGQSRVWPLYPGYSFHPTGGADDASVAEIGKTGGNYPIQTTKYKRLSFRINSTTTDSWLVGWSTTRATSYAGFVQGNYATGWRVYTVDMNWGSTPATGIAFQLGANSSATYKFDWIRLTDPNTSPIYTIRFSVAAAQAGDLVDLNCYTSAQLSNATYCGVIASGIAVNSSGTYQYQWRTAYLAPGNYYVQAVARRGGASDVSNGPLTIKAAPVVQIDSPSMTSGPDYATTEAGNPWDMNDSTDIKSLTWTTHDFNSAGPVFSGGQLNGVVARYDSHDPTMMGDPFVYLNVKKDTKPIDTGKYKYLTFRYKVDRTPWWSHSGDRLAEDVARRVYPAAWLVRVIFYGASIADYEHQNMTNDIIIFDDWNTYTMDLSKGVQQGYWEPGQQGASGGYWSGLKYWMRFDFLEGVDPWQVHLDYIKLTGNDEASTTYAINWTQLEGEKLSSVDVYRSQNQAACLTSGTALYHYAASAQAGQPEPDAGSAGSYKIFLPILQRHEMAPTSINWNTATISNGEYFICMRMSDGYNTFSTVSEAPVKISH